MRDDGPTWSLDGTQIAFSSNRGGRRNIWVVNADGTGARQVTTGGAAGLAASEPSWSQHNTIAFSGVTTSAGGSRNDIYTINADGTGLVKLTDATTPGAVESDPAFSPDGTRIAFVSSFRLAQNLLNVMSSDGTGRVELASGVSLASPAWTADGTRILFTDRAPSQGADLFAVAPVAGAPVLRLSESNVSEDNPAVAGAAANPRPIPASIAPTA